MKTPSPPDPSTRSLAWRLLAAAVLLALVWYVRHALMLVFGAVLVAVVLHALAGPLRRHAGLGKGAALGIMLVALLAAACAAVWRLGDPLSLQVASLGSELPRAWETLRGWLDGSTLGSQLLDSLRSFSLSSLPLARVAGIAEATLQGLLAALVVVVMGIYLAFDVGLYKRGLVRLLPVPERAGFEAALDAAGGALTRWLVSRLVTMIAVGALVAAGLWFLEMPLALVLGLIAGLLEFVPFFGPIASGLLAVLVAFAQGPQTALWVALLFLVVQQLEGNLLTPLAQRWAIHLPPVLSVASVLVFGALFGLLGVVFGSPLVVVLMIMVRRLWVEQTLEGRPA